MPRRITLPTRRIGEVGYMSRYPFADLLPGDELVVPYIRCDTKSVYVALTRFIKKYPERRFTCGKLDGPGSDTLVTRIA